MNCQLALKIIIFHRKADIILKLYLAFYLVLCKMKRSMSRALFLFLILISTSCITSLAERRREFEKHLESFVGKKERAVTIEFGQPDEYYNGQAGYAMAGTYMIYKSNFANLVCEIKFKVAEKEDKVLEWDYQGNGCY